MTAPVGVLLGAALRKVRGDQAIPLMAQRLGVNKNTLGSYERGQATPDVNFLVRFAAVTGTSLEHLIDLHLREAGAPITSAQLKHFDERERPTEDGCGNRHQAAPTATPPGEFPSAVDAVPERLRAVRAALGETQKSMSARFGLGEGTWQALEIQERLPKGEVLTSLVGLGFSAHWLLTGEGPMWRALPPRCPEGPPPLPASAVDAAPQQASDDDRALLKELLHALLRRLEG